MFIKSYSRNDCKSMVCVQYDICAVLVYVKRKIVHYIICCIARDVLQKMVGLLKEICNMQIWAQIERTVQQLKSKDKSL